MVEVTVRAVASVVTVVVAILATTQWGESPESKLIAAVMSAVVIASIEWFVRWSPRHIRWARRLFDTRAIWTGLWLQRVVRISDATGRVSHDDNAFAILRIGYEHGYAVDGGAYDRAGRRVASFESDGDPTFTQDGRKMSYVWKGLSLREDDRNVEPDRTGVTTMSFRPGNRNDVTGRVDHVAEKRRIDFEMVRVTNELLSRHGVSGAYGDQSTTGEVAQLATELAQTMFDSKRR